MDKWLCWRGSNQLAKQHAFLNPFVHCSSESAAVRAAICVPKWGGRTREIWLLWGSLGDGSLRDREVAGNTGRKYSGAGCCRMKTVKAQQLVSS